MSDRPSDSRAGSEPVPSSASTATGSPGVRWLARLMLAVLVMAMLLAGLVASLYSARGSVWIVRCIPGLTVEQASGALMGDFRAQRVVWTTATSSRLMITDLMWRSPSWRRAPQALVGWGLVWPAVQARRVQWMGSGASSGPLRAPERLDLPLALSVDRLKVDEVRWSADEQARPWLGLVAAVHLQTQRGGTTWHLLSVDEVRWDHWSVQGHVDVQTRGSMTVQGRLALGPIPALAKPGSGDVPDCSVAGAAPRQARSDMQTSVRQMHAAIEVEGPLARLGLRGSVMSRGQCATAQATVAPFADSFIERLHLELQHLDLAELDTRSPRTELSGGVDLTPVSSTRAAPNDKQSLLTVDASNAQAGNWSELRVPVRRLTLRATLGAGWWRQGHVDELDAELGSNQVMAGHVRGGGEWDLGTAPRGGRSTSGTLTSTKHALLRLDFEGVRLRQLDLDAPAWTVDGDVQANSTLSPSAEASGAPAVHLQTKVQARDDDQEHHRATPSAQAGAKVQAALTWRDRRVDLEQFLAQHGDAAVQASGQVQWGEAGVVLKARGQAHDVDPAVWWPSLKDRIGTGVSRLNGSLDADLLMQTHAPSQRDTFSGWRSATGSLKLQVQPSTLAGVPVQGALELNAEPAQTPQLHAQLMMADNQMHLNAQLDRGSGVGDRWDIELAAPQLRQAQALMALFGVPPLSGSLSAQARVRGRWPDLKTQGHAAVSGLRAETGAAAEATYPAAATGTWQVALASAQWDIDTGAGAPVQAQITAQEVKAAGGWGASELQAQLVGTAKAHRWSLNARTVMPSLRKGAREAAVDVANERGSPSHAEPPKGATVVGDLQVRGNGRLALSDQAKHPTWSARVDECVWRPVATPSVSGLASGAGHQPVTWLELKPFSLEISNMDSAWSISSSPIQAQILGAALRVSEFQWQGREHEPAQFQVDAQLEPLSVAPLLARWQPQAGWGGDLTLGGHVRMHTHGGVQGFSADLELARIAGDLTLTDSAIEGASVLRLGLSEWHLAVKAEQGVWTLSEKMVGRVLGEVQGEQRLAAAPGSVWPNASSALEGQIALQIGNLRPWGTWSPPGWRLSGQVLAQAKLSGRLGAPNYEGRVTGKHLGASNVLEGVNISEGELAMSLNREDARIETFVMHSTQGQLSATGGASFGAQPQAYLHLLADKFGLLQRVDRQAVVSGALDVEINAQAMQIKGRLALDQGVIDVARSEAPSLGDDVQVDRPRGQDEDEAEAIGTSGNVLPKRKINVDLTLELGSKRTAALALRGRGINAQLGGQLHLTNSTVSSATGAMVNKPLLVGVVTVARGDYAAYGQQLNIERGSIVFEGPVNNPRLDIWALRKQSPTLESDVKVGVTITGTAQEPRVRLFSEPEMSDTEKLSWLVLGHGSNGLGRTDVALLQSAASALLAGESGNGSVFQAVGLDELSVRQDDTTVHQTIVTVGKQLSKRWYVGYERSLSATAGTWQLIYQWAQHVTVRAQSGLDNSLDLIWTLRWQ